VRVSNTNPAKRCVVTGFYDGQLKLQEDFKWSGPPEVLTNNDAYAKLTPAEAVKAYFAAQSKLDWVEMRKFTSEFDVEGTKRQMEAAEKQGMDVRKLMRPTRLARRSGRPRNPPGSSNARPSKSKNGTSP